MKMFYNGTPIKSMKVKHYEISTNDCTMTASDLQSGVTGVARGKKIVGTGKAFSFAMYGDCPSNVTMPIPTSEINTLLISANNYSVRMEKSTREFRDVDLSTEQEIAAVNINGVDYPVVLKIANNMLTVSCNQTITLQVLFGKDDYT